MGHLMFLSEFQRSNHVCVGNSLTASPGHHYSSSMKLTQVPYVEGVALATVKPAEPTETGLLHPVQPAIQAETHR